MSKTAFIRGAPEDVGLKSCYDFAIDIENCNTLYAYDSCACRWYRVDGSKIEVKDHLCITRDQDLTWVIESKFCKVQTTTTFSDSDYLVGCIGGENRGIKLIDIANYVCNICPPTCVKSGSQNVDVIWDPITECWSISVATPPGYELPLVCENEGQCNERIYIAGKLVHRKQGMTYVCTMDNYIVDYTNTQSSGDGVTWDYESLDLSTVMGADGNPISIPSCATHAILRASASIYSPISDAYTGVRRSAGISAGAKFANPDGGVPGSCQTTRGAFAAAYEGAGDVDYRTESVYAEIDWSGGSPILWYRWRQEFEDYAIEGPTSSRLALFGFWCNAKDSCDE